VIEHDDGSWSATLTLLPVGALNAPATLVEVDGNAVIIKAGTPGMQARIEGVLDEACQRLTGTVSVPDAEPASAPFELARTPRADDLPTKRAWKGTIGLSGFEFDMAFVFAETPGGHWVGHCDVPSQQLQAFPFVNVDRDGDRLTAVLPLPAPVTIDVKIDDGEGRMTGSFKQGAFDVPIAFSYDADYTWRGAVRPQHPQPPFPYDVVEFSAPHPDGHALAGTLTVPARETFGDGPFPLAVLVSGSGQQDRDETVLGHKPFLVIADHLTRHGIAVARYDDRGVGGSVLEDMDSLRVATSRDFATDTLAVVRAVRGMDRVDPNRVGLVGHSEGGIIAPMVAALTDIDFMVLLAVPGVRGDALLRQQTRLMLGASGFDAELFAKMQPDLDAVLATIVDQASGDELRPKIETLLRTQGELGIVPAGADLDAIVQQSLALYDNGWMRFFAAYDPEPALAAATCPVLAMNGTLDLQVWHEQNLDAIERIRTAAGRPVTINRYEGLNHLFQPARTGLVNEYATIETTFDEQALADLTRWILDVTEKSASG
jgi:fermentation-respiration switch protein FrsA (DUF1100 family)